MGRMHSTPLLSRTTDWWCPNCSAVDRTTEARPHTRMHQCHGKAGMLMPMVEKGVQAKVELVERGDYVGDELVRVDGNGRPWMAAVTTGEDGQDVAVFAPTAQGTGRAA